MYKELRQRVLEANLALPRLGLVKYTWGNVSARDPVTGHVLIKPSGLPYEDMRAEHMVVLDLDGQAVEGSLRPSSDAPTHLALYRAFPQIGGIVHTHSPEATAWAQAGLDIPLYGTTHADHFAGPIPCARALTLEEIQGEYELNTGLVMIETINTRGIDPLHIPAMLCTSHGAFAWGEDVEAAVMNAGVLEEVARMARWTRAIHPGVQPAADALRDKHFFRKHGENAYYGQDN
ncbi:MAG: L-ribulose-5-phosphate 4-epimerase [Clostridiales bacterium]|nr:L-ribulose-5-phosphate 4-epimerase [Clostridiales bacterium]